MIWFLLIIAWVIGITFVLFVFHNMKEHRDERWDDSYENLKREFDKDR